jgi:hypothetical protein
MVNNYEEGQGSQRAATPVMMKMMMMKKGMTSCDFQKGCYDHFTTCDNKFMCTNSFVPDRNKTP